MDNQDAYPVNFVDFNKRCDDSTVSGGSLHLSFWDMKKKSLVHKCKNGKNPITCGKTSPCGKFVAFAFGDDWHLGPDHQQKQPTNTILAVLDIE